MIQAADIKPIYEEHKSRLTSFIYRLTTNKEEAEDLVHDTFEAALNSLEKFKGDSSVKTWLFSIAAHKAIDHIRKRKRWPASILEQSRQTAFNDHGFLNNMKHISEEPNGKFEIREHIDFCFTCISKTLPIEQQVCTLLKEIYGFTVKEIACIISRTESVVKHALEDGRAKLIDVYEKKCALINKNGTCHQCSEMSGFYNPKSNTQAELMRIKFARESASLDKQKLFELRTELISSVDQFEGVGAKFQLTHMKHAASVAESS